MKKILLYLLLAAALLCGCTSAVPQTTERTSFPEIKGFIMWFDVEQRNHIQYYGYIPPEHRFPTYMETDYLDDPKLQSAVADLQVEYPLDTDEKVTAYAWKLYDICIELGYFEAIWEPCYISCYADGIIDISFLDPQYIGHYYDGYAPILYISALDGHIIEFTSNDA